MTDLRRTTLRRLLLLSALMGGASLVEDTATGNPVVFSTEVSKPLVSLIANFLPVQTGSGDPSPSNIRPIVPWEGLTVWNGGKNLAQLAPSIRTEDREQNGIKFHAVSDSVIHIKGTASGNAYATVANVETDLFLKAGKYRLSTNLDRGTGNSVYLSSADASIGYNASYKDHPVTITLSHDTEDVNVQVLIATGTEIDADIWIMLEVGETESEYTPSAITETDISFPSPVYGGTLDAVTGVLTVEYAIVALNTVKFYAVREGFFASFAFLPAYADRTKLMCNAYKVVSKTYWDDMLDCEIMSIPEGGIIRIKDESCADVTALETQLTEKGAVLAYTLPEPQTVQLTPQQITTLVGNNTIWSDADGQLTAVYLKKA